MEYALIIIVAVLIIVMTGQQGRILYYRHFKSYDKEIVDFLKTHNYEFIEKRKPNNEDWQKSPFKKPPVFEMSFPSIRINGLPVTWTGLRYKVITGSKQNKTKRIWLEIKTTYFKKPVLNFLFDKR